MYKIITFEDSVRVPPEYIGEMDEAEAISKALSDKYENKILRDIGVILAVTDVSEIGEGEMRVEDPAVHYPAKFAALVWMPRVHEVVEGTVVDITDFGVFVRFGPIDGLCHISQVINDYVSHDRKSGMLVAKQSRKTLRVGDVVRARVTGVSLEKKEVNKITLTMRQPGLGALEWLEEEKRPVEKEKK